LAEPDFNFLARQNERILTEIGSLRDEQRVQGAMIMRLDTMVVRSESTQIALLEEMRAVHAQVSRMNDRIRKLEDATFPDGA
jgi:predicted regulator of Ras-like GTPase activity (Roadblock/LC7/MglB family)